MKVRVKRWQGVAIWKWEIDEEVRIIYSIQLDDSNADALNVQHIDYH